MSKCHGYIKTVHDSHLEAPERLLVPLKSPWLSSLLKWLVSLHPNRWPWPSYQHRPWEKYTESTNFTNGIDSVYFTAPANLQEVMIISSQVSGEQITGQASSRAGAGRKSAQSLNMRTASSVDIFTESAPVTMYVCRMSVCPLVVTFMGLYVDFYSKMLFLKLAEKETIRKEKNLEKKKWFFIISRTKPPAAAASEKGPFKKRHFIHKKGIQGGRGVLKSG